MNKNKEIRTIYWYIDRIEELEKLERLTPNNFELGGKFRDYIKGLKEGEKFNWKKDYSIGI